MFGYGPSWYHTIITSARRGRVFVDNSSMLYKKKRYHDNNCIIILLYHPSWYTKPGVCCACCHECESVCDYVSACTSAWYTTVALFAMPSCTLASWYGTCAVQCMTKGGCWSVTLNNRVLNVNQRTCSEWRPIQWYCHDNVIVFCEQCIILSANNTEYRITILTSGTNLRRSLLIFRWISWIPTGSCCCLAGSYYGCTMDIQLANFPILDG